MPIEPQEVASWMVRNDDPIVFTVAEVEDDSVSILVKVSKRDFMRLVVIVIDNRVGDQNADTETLPGASG